MDITARTPAPVGADLAIELLLASPEVEAFGRRTATEVTRARVSARADAGARGGAVASARARIRAARWPCWCPMTTPRARWPRTPSQYLPRRGGRLPAVARGDLRQRPRAGRAPRGRAPPRAARARSRRAGGGVGRRLDRAGVAQAASAPAPISVTSARRSISRRWWPRSPRPATSARTTSRSGASSRSGGGLIDVFASTGRSRSGSSCSATRSSGCRRSPCSPSGRCASSSGSSCTPPPRNATAPRLG